MTSAALERVSPAPARRSRASAWLTIAARAAGDAVSGWLVPGITGAYAAAAVLVTFVGLAAGGTIEAQDFGRTAQSLLVITLWIVPLAAVLTGALAVADDGELTLLLVQPVSRLQVFIGRWAGATGAVLAGVVMAWGLVGLLIGGLAGWSDAAGYLAVGGTAAGCVLVGSALGAAGGAAAGRRGPAIVAALGVWFALAVAYDFVAIAMLGVGRELAGSGWTPAALAGLNPFGALRVLGTLGVGGQELTFGAVTAAVEQSGTGRLPPLLAASVVLWSAGALGLGAWLFGRRDR